MIDQLAIATGMILLTILIHALGLLGLRRVVGLELTHSHLDLQSHVTVRGVAVTVTVVLGVFVLHGIEIWLYAGLYRLLGALPDMHEAVYFSTITYGTVGYDDEGIERSWELIAAIEGINGIILLGWSTAFFVSVGSRVARH
jgi:hypothetical protein